MKIKLEIKRMSLLTLLLSALSSAQQGGNFEIDKSNLSSGGGQSTGGTIELIGTVGQAVAANQSLGGQFSLTGGFWAQGERPDAIFKDSFEN